ncbi:MAG: hypothetical protein NZ823_02235 [Blastocatellia bacterium]|nr:hypothetical protein [Blastocatellia bacterium]
MRAYITVAMMLSVLASLAQEKEKLAQEIFMKEKEIFLRQGPAQVVQLTHDGKPKYNVQLSPEKQWVVYHGEPTQESPAVVQFLFGVIDLKDFTKKEIRFHVLKGARIEKVEWVNAYRIGVMASIEGRNSYYAIFDAQQGREIDYVLGRIPSVSPDRSKIAYLAIVPRNFPPELSSDFICSVDLSLSDAQIQQQIHQPQATYPERAIKEPFSNLDERHFVRSNLAWSQDSRSIAFVEQHQGAFWVTILDVESARGRIKVHNIRKLQLAKAEQLQLRDEAQVTWGGPDTLVVSGTKWVWDQGMNQYREGSKVQWRIDLTKGVVLAAEPEQR